ncbi:MAG: flavin monoamine oxidase family protein [Bacillaceae bacterium]
MHTPLLKALVQAVKRGHHELEQMNAENKYEENKMSRRELLKKGAVIATAAMIPNFLTETIPKGTAAISKKIAIIGGGLAGLTAAFRLNQQGIPVTLYEGNIRLGGRCWSGGKGWESGFTKDGQYEVGGELIDTTHLNIINLIGELNKNYSKYLHNNTPIELDNLYAEEPTDTHDLYYFSGKPYDYQTSIKDLKAILPYVQSDYRKSGFPTTYYRSTKMGEILDMINLKEYIYGAPTKPYHPYTLAARAGDLLTPQLQKLLEIAYITEYGAEIEQQNTLNFIYLFGTATRKTTWIFGESDETYHIRGGNETIVRTLHNAIKDLGTTIHLGHILTNISYTNKQYVLSFKNGVQETYDYVICAIPFRILREILTESNMRTLGFKKQKIDSILHYPMGYNTKHFIQFNERYWHKKECNGATFSDLETQMTWETTRGQITTGTTTYNGAGILVAFTGGDASYSVTQQSLTTVTENTLLQLEKIMPGIKASYANKTTMMPWPIWQFTKGAYSYYGVGQYKKFAGVEIEREGNMYFCGEHTSINFQGYLNGAVETGEIVAKKLRKEIINTSTSQYA